MLRKLLGVMRGPSLLLVPASLAPAYAVAWLEQGYLNPLPVMLIFIAALAAHIAVNTLNEYDDFRSGLDFDTTRTPFSGGSGTLVESPEFAPVALRTGIISVLVTLFIGLYFFWQVGGALVVPGVLGLMIIVAYSRWVNRFPLLCLIAPGLGFGLLMMNLSVLVLTGNISQMSLWTSIPVTLLVSNLLLINQFPDAEADQRVGRRHLAIAWGQQWAAWVSVALLVGSYLSIVWGWQAGLLPNGALLALLTVPLALFVASKVLAFKSGVVEEFVPGMGVNVALTLVTPLLLSGGILFST